MSKWARWFIGGISAGGNRLRPPGCRLLAVALILAAGTVPRCYADDLDEFDTLNLVAIDLHRHGSYAESAEAAKRALAIAEVMSGRDDLVVKALTNLGTALRAAGRLAEAEPVLSRNLALAERMGGADGTRAANAAKRLAALYHDQGRLGLAEPLYRRALAIDEKELGPEDSKTADDLNSLGLVLLDAGRFGEAEPLLKRALAVREKIHEPDDLMVTESLNNLAGLYQEQGRLAEAEALYERSLAIRESLLGPDHADVAMILNNIAGVHKEQGRYEKAGTLYVRALAIREKGLGPEHALVATTLNNLSNLRDAEGRRDEAIALQKRSLAIREKLLGPWHPDVAVSLGNLSSLYAYAGRAAEAEPLVKRALAIREKAYGANHIDVALSLNNLAQTYEEMGRFEEAKPLFDRALAVQETALGPEHASVAATLHNMASLARAHGDFERARQLALRALAIREKVYGREHPNVAQSLNSVALTLQELKRFDEALPMFERSLAIREKALGPNHPGVGIALNNLAAVLLDLGRSEEAEKLYLRSLSVTERALGGDHLNSVSVLSNIAELHLRGGNWPTAESYWTRSTGILMKRRAVALAQSADTPAGRMLSEADSISKQYQMLVKAAYRHWALSGGDDTAVKERLFVAGQWAAGSEAADALAQTAARSAKGTPALEALVREKQDLAAAWRALDARRTAAAAQPPERRRPDEEKAAADEMSLIEQRLKAADTRLRAEFADYAAFASPDTVSIADVQKDLAADEVLLFVLVTGELKPAAPEETYVWAVTKAESRWRRADALPARMRREVQALRCGLDAAEWVSAASAEECAALLNLSAAEVPKGDAPLPFDHVRAHRLYTALFSGFEDLIAGRQILAVASEPLNGLPLHVLVTAPSQGSDNRRIAWLARRNAITVLPSVAALKSLRRVSRRSLATSAFIGFGNPLLDGDQTHPRWGAYYASKAAEARAISACAAPAGETRVAALGGGPRGPLAPGRIRGADLAGLHTLSPLPETADELCAVARDLAPGDSVVKLGTAATKTAVKALSTSGELARYRVLHFATHGLLAGQLAGTSEPGLVMTPPQAPSADDDGYLSASEIGGLRIDADWVILSACNTAGGEGSGTGAEALSGLARAFFYAGARALLVSHWEVNSDAAVKLVTHAAGATGRDARLARAEALRRAMVALIDSGSAEDARPSVWAPFVLVGEGGANR